MQTISISNRFFSHELNSYSNWKQAFWRELIQNSVDANAKIITITTEELPNKYTKISFQDNGPGVNCPGLKARGL